MRASPPGSFASASAAVASSPHRSSPVRHAVHSAARAHRRRFVRPPRARKRATSRRSRSSCLGSRHGTMACEKTRARSVHFLGQGERRRAEEQRCVEDRLEIRDARHERAHEVLLAVPGHVPAAVEGELRRAEPGEDACPDARRGRDDGHHLEARVEIRVDVHGGRADAERGRRPCDGPHRAHRRRRAGSGRRRDRAWAACRRGASPRRARRAPPMR